jgi:transposase
MLLSEGQMSDFKGAALMLPALPKARELLADKGYDADWFRAALAKRRIAACIPSKSNRKVAIPHDALLYKQRHKIENMFGRLKDWRRIPPDTTVAPTPTSRQSASPLPSPFGSDQ